jgi:hypothetical protein
MEGGAIRGFSWRGENVLRPTPADAGDDPFDAACFPMVPFVNRVALGRCNFGALGRNVGEATVVYPGKRIAIGIQFEIGAS